MKKYRLILTLAILLSIPYASFSQNNNPAKAHINHTAIFVVDLKKSGDFYMNVVGLDTIPEPFHDGKHIWLQTSPHTQMHIIQGAPEAKTYYKNQHTCFSVGSVDAFAKMLLDKKIAFEDVKGSLNTITTRVDGVKQIWLQDPDGYWVEINDAKD
ncbi:VOC family protein [Ferruginibacter sp. SUN106]|uniref:VOC family protein n=1 Tax=Ferruginibacter sp. SUN106 TaxID=2978348 RepID=UPI003D3657CC